MSFFEVLAAEARAGWTPWLLLTVLGSWVASRRSPDHPRFKAVSFLVVAHTIGLITTTALVLAHSEHAEAFRLPSWLFGAVAFVGSIATFLFSAVLPKLRLRTPLILRDVIVAIASVFVCVSVASRANVSLSGLIATSAVFTAMLGFSLQDVIGNIAGGLALQIDNTVDEGDWVRIGDVTGRVVEIRWRYTALETRNWETVLIPNSVLMKSQVTVFARRRHQPKLARRIIHFNVDWAHQPSDVIAAIQTAVRSAKIERVSAEPLPTCVLLDMADSFGRYALRYWLTDLAADDPTDSDVRTCIYFALQRAEMRLAQPVHSVSLNERTPDKEALKSRKQLARRVALFSSIDLFATLDEAERTELAGQLKYAPFTRGEVMTRQGAEAHWLYLVEDGTASVRVSDGTHEREVATLKGPTVFGEMSVLTGDPRSATVIALSDVECFRLDKAAVQQVLSARPALATELAELLAHRRSGLNAAREGLSADALKDREARDAQDLLTRIRRFLSLE